VKFLGGLWSTVGQGVVGAIPHILSGIEFRRVGREVLRVYAGVAPQEVLGQLTPMNGTAIPQQDDGAMQMA